jgi:hypothetical protein
MPAISICASQDRWTASLNGDPEDLLRQTAAREFHEEVGVRLAPSALRLWAVKDGGAGDVGVFNTAHVGRTAVLRDVFSRHVEKSGERAEFASLVIVRGRRRTAGPGLAPCPVRPQTR